MNEWHFGKNTKMKIDEITQLKVLAGIIDKAGNTVESSDESNVSITGTEKAEYQRKNKIEPGTEEWFRLWFAKPKLTGEDPMKGKK